MFILNRAKLMKALREERKKTRYGMSAGYIYLFIKNTIKDLDGCLKSESGRDSFEFVTGIEVKRIGPFIF